MARQVIDTNYVQDLVQNIFSMQFRHGPVLKFDADDLSLIDVGPANCIVIDRIFAQLAMQAAKGDVKSAEILFKYGKLAPPEEKHLIIDQPTIIDDIKEAPAAIPAKAALPLAIEDDLAEEE